MSQKEKEIQAFMEKYDLTKEEATQLWMEDNEEIENAEIEEMTKKAKENIKRYEKNTSKERKKSTRERKVDTEKGTILGWFKECLESKQIESNQENEVALHFQYNGNEYSIKLTRHRQK